MADHSTYVVLHERSTGTETAWGVVDIVNASSAAAAIRTIAEINPADGSYVAVPMRSWKPLQVTATTQTVLKIT